MVRVLGLFVYGCGLRSTFLGQDMRFCGFWLCAYGVGAGFRVLKFGLVFGIGFGLPGLRGPRAGGLKCLWRVLSVLQFRKKGF